MAACTRRRTTVRRRSEYVDGEGGGERCQGRTGGGVGGRYEADYEHYARHKRHAGVGGDHPEYLVGFFREGEAVVRRIHEQHGAEHEKEPDDKELHHAAPYHVFP